MSEPLTPLGMGCVIFAALVVIAYVFRAEIKDHFTK